MPGGDGTGPFGDPNWPCRRIRGFGARFRSGFGRGYGRGFRACGAYWAQNPQYNAPVSLTKEEQIKILEAELREIEAEKQEIEKMLKELKKQ